MMSVAAFLTAALESALDNGMGTPDDVLRHATPDVIAAHVPRPVWARLLAACLSAPRTDARLVVDTVGIATLCQHVPHPIMYACLAELALRALGRGLVAAPPPSASTTAPAGVAKPPAAAAAAAAARGEQRAPTVPGPDAARAVSGNGARPVPAEPLPLGDPPVAPARASRASGTMRRPQAPAQPPPAARAEGTRQTPLPARRRATSATDFDVETDVGEAWKRADAVPVDDDQLIDWAQAEETATKSDKFGH